MEFRHPRPIADFPWQDSGQPFSQLRGFLPPPGPQLMQTTAAQLLQFGSTHRHSSFTPFAGHLLTAISIARGLAVRTDSSVLRQAIVSRAPSSTVTSGFFPSRRHVTNDSI